MLLAVLKLSKVTVVDYASVATPVLIIGGECDRIVPSEAVRKAAARYRYGTSVEIAQSDHMVFSGTALPVAMNHIDDWIAKNRVFSPA
jgi:alpha-beta hydrolase superfamily lysophospholipase